MKIDSEKLIQDLIERTRLNINQAEKLKSLDIKQLNRRAEPKSWSVLECFEHLNRYGDFYIPEIKRSIENSKEPSNEKFKAGMLGEYFAKSMLPKQKLNKMKTFKVMNPIGSQLDKAAIDRFIAQQEQMLNLLDKARTVNLSKTKTAVSISKWIKLKLGDTFRVVVYHNDRHILQANKVLDTLKQV